eukprot:GHRQ01012350.1.p1 GENE.GHRQ01012350.1~~GHRQ01012350.1.p1  ORF type:complete len:321 (+),score=61.85 GHRQ01012350.1:400-1362(+)
MATHNLLKRSLAVAICLVLSTTCSCRVLHLEGAEDGSNNNATAANSSAAASRAAEAAFYAAQWSNNSLICLQTLPQQPGKPQTIAPVKFSKKDYSKCGRYQFQCSKGIASCTLAEQASETWKWAYVPMAPRSCVRSVYMDRRPGSSSSSTQSLSGNMMPVSRHVFCCSSDACNMPDRRLDQQTEVLAAAPEELAKVPASWRSCQVTQKRIGSLVKSVKYKKADGWVACGRYQYRCNSTLATPPNTTTCSRAAQQSGAWAWHYTAMTKQRCEGLSMEAVRLGLRLAACCYWDNCNRPDRAVDNSTVVVKWTGMVTSDAPGE